MGSGKGAEILKQSLEATKQIADEIKAGDEAKTQIREKAPDCKSGVDIVRQQIHTDGNGTLPSLAEHRRRIGVRA